MIAPAGGSGIWQRRLRRWSPAVSYTVFLLATVPLVPYLNERAQQSQAGAHLVAWGPFYLSAAVVACALAFSRRPFTFGRILALAAAATGGALLLLLLDDPPIERVHLPEYCLLACLFLLALAGESSFSSVAWPAWLLASAVGLLDECLQLLVPSRVFDWRDVASNAASAAIGILLARGCGWFLGPHERPTTRLR